MSQRTAFFHLGELVEEGVTEEMFTSPKTGARRTTSRDGSAELRSHLAARRRLRVPRRRRASMNEHIVKSYEQELALLDKKIAQMGGLAEQLLGQAFDALERRDPKLAEDAVSRIRRSTSSSARSRSRPSR